MPEDDVGTKNCCWRPENLAEGGRNPSRGSGKIAFVLQSHA